MAEQRSYYETLTAAVADIAEHGYDSAERVDFWATELRRAAERSMRPEAEVDRLVREAMSAIFRREVDMGGVLRRNPGVGAYTLEKIKPALHAELSRRVAASTNLIKLNRTESIRKTEQRFRGWATSVPVGGSDTVEKVEQKKEIRKALAQLPFEERRCIIDGNSKLFAAINDTVATNGGAIGAFWQSHKYQQGYRGRPLHNARDGKFFLLKDSWAHQSGLVKQNANGYTIDVEQPGALIYCRCSWVWKFSLRSIPVECLTDKGERTLREAREKIRQAA